MRPKRQDVTLIVSVKCSDGFALCADSQETVGAYRVSRQKLIPFSIGNFEVAIGGSGNDGRLIDSFVQRLQDNLGASQVKALSELRGFIHRELLDFEKNEAATYSRKQREMQFIIGARSLEPPASISWVTSASRLTPVESYALIGYEDYRYADVLTRLYRRHIPLGQAIFLGLHVISLAEQTSNYVKAPVTVVTVKDHEIKTVPQPEVDALQDRVKLFGSQFDALFLACPDTGLQPTDFLQTLREFVNTVTGLRKEYTEESVKEMLDRGLANVNDSFNPIPFGTMVFVTPNTAQIAEFQRSAQERAKGIRAENKGEQDLESLTANLNAIRSCMLAHLKHAENPELAEAPTQEMRLASMVASGELMRAAMMGPYRISEAAVRAVGWTIDFVRSDPGLGAIGNLTVFIAAIDGCLDVVRREGASSTSPLLPSPQSPNAS